jgi:hypothetical protein
MYRRDLIDYFNRVAIISLPESRQRLASLMAGLQYLGIPTAHPKLQFPKVPRPAEADGFTSHKVRSNFLAHLQILRDARDEGLDNVWVLEDDAMFSRRMRHSQASLVSTLEQREWDLCFFGHSLKPLGKPTGLVPTRLEFIHAHCYAVHGKVLRRLVEYLEQTLERPVGHPLGAKVPTDGGFNLFRRFNPDVVTLVSNPLLSRQKGCPSGIQDGRWYDKYPLARSPLAGARLVRDELWKMWG